MYKVNTHFILPLATIKMQSLIKDIKKIIEVGDSDLEKILTSFQSKSFGKSEMIPSYGKISNYMQFIQSGLIRVYTIDKQAKEITIQIGIENMWVNDLYSYFTNTPSQNHIQVLMPTTILQIHKNDLKKLLKKVPVMESFIRIKTQQSYIRLYNRTLHQLNNSAEERYLEFRNKYGYIENRVPQYIIASYLNLSPEHLSKVRNKLSQK